MAFPNNPHHNKVWFQASTIAIQSAPSDAAFCVHEGLKDVAAGNIATYQQRRNIFDNFTRAAKSGDGRGIFFESFCWKFGFGRDADPATGDALFRVAAIARETDLAVRFLYLCLGTAYLTGKKDIPQDYRQAIHYLRQAGAIAIPERDMLAEHFKRQALRQEQQSKFREFPAVPYRPRMLCTS